MANADVPLKRDNAIKHQPAEPQAAASASLGQKSESPWQVQTPTTTVHYPTQTSSNLFQSTFDGIRNAALNLAPRGLVNNSVRVNQALSVAGDALNIYASDIRGINKRSTAGWVSMAVSALAVALPSKPQTKEDLESYNKMSLPEYAYTRVRQAIFEPQNHITQTIGLSQMVNGALYMGAAFDIAKMGQKSTRNGILMQGALTTLAGATLLFGKNVEKAWQWSTGIFYARYYFTIPNSIKEHNYISTHPINPKTGLEYEGNQQMIAAWAQPFRVTMQFTSNCVGFLFGGAHKDENGNIISLNRKASENETELADSATPDAKIAAGALQATRVHAAPQPAIA